MIICENWAESSRLTPETLENLFINQLACIRVQDFVAPTDCALLSEQILTTEAFLPYSCHPPESGLTKLGPVQCEYEKHEKAKYFERGRDTKKVLDQLKLGFDPVEKVMNLFHSITDANLSIAHDLENGSYFAGAIHCLKNEGMALHMDYAYQDAPGWSISDVTEQLSWVLQLRAPLRGGETVIYNRQWIPEDELLHRVGSSYHYNQSVVENVPSIKVPFRQGDLIIFNCRNYHEIYPSLGSRISLGSFLGRFKGGQMRFWS